MLAPTARNPPRRRRHDLPPRECPLPVPTSLPATRRTKPHLSSRTAPAIGAIRPGATASARGRLQAGRDVNPIAGRGRPVPQAFELADRRDLVATWTLAGGQVDRLDPARDSGRCPMAGPPAGPWVGPCRPSWGVENGAQTLRLHVADEALDIAAAGDAELPCPARVGQGGNGAPIRAGIDHDVDQLFVRSNVAAQEEQVRAGGPHAVAEAVMEVVARHHDHHGPIHIRLRPNATHDADSRELITRPTLVRRVEQDDVDRPPFHRPGPSRGRD